MANQLVSRKALKRYGLANIVPGSSHNAIGKRLRVRTLLEFIGWKYNKETSSVFHAFL